MQTSAFCLPAPLDVSPGGSCIWRDSTRAPALCTGCTLLPHLAKLFYWSRGEKTYFHTSHAKTKTAERPFRERPAFSEGKALRSRFPLFPRPDARSPRATAALRNRTPGGAICAGAERGRQTASARARRPSRSQGRGLRDGVMGRGLGRREAAAGEWRWRRAAVGRPIPGPRTLPLPPARPPVVPATTSCRGEGPGHK